MNKKAIAILGAIFILIVGTLGFLIYSKSSGSSKTSTNTPSPTPTPQPTQVSGFTPTPTPLPTQTNSGSKFFKLTDDQVVSPALTFDGNGVAYFTKQGLLFRATFAPGSGSLNLGDKKQLAIEPKVGISKVIWPQNTQDFMLEYNSVGKKSFEFYDNNVGKFTKLPEQVYSLGFLPAGDKIYYVWSASAGNDTVNISNPDTSEYKTLSEIWDKNAVVYVSPDGLNVLYYQDPAFVSGAINPLVLTDTAGKTWRKVVDGFVSGVLWSPDGKKFLFSKKDPNSQKFQLWYYDLYSGVVNNFGLFTSPSKAVWGTDNQTVYAAVPNDSSLTGGTFSLDSFYKINTQTGEKKQYDPGSQQIDGEDLFLSKDSSKLFFRNGQDGGLYYLDLNN